MTKTPTIEEAAAARLYVLWNDLFCAVLGIALDIAAVVAAVHFYRSGDIPGWLDGHGRWAWFGAGAAVAAFVLVEVPDTLMRFDRAFWVLWFTYRPTPAGLTGGERR